MRKISISKIFKTETAHIVRNAISKRCKFNVHGHSYKWIVTIKGPINPETGMVLDFKELKPIGNFIDNFDHAMVLWGEDNPEFIDFFIKNTQRHLIMKKNPTAENMASLVHKFVVDWLTTNYGHEYFCKQIEVWETETGKATSTSHDGYDILLSPEHQLKGRN